MFSVYYLTTIGFECKNQMRIKYRLEMYVSIFYNFKKALATFLNILHGECKFKYIH